MTLNNGVKSIADYAFYGNKNIASVKLSKNVKSFGNDAFYDCNNLNRVEIPESVDYIGEWAFAQSEKAMLYVVKDSYAEVYAKEKDLKYDYISIEEPSEPSKITGDANGDGKISAIDARIVLKMAANGQAPTAEELALLDTNGDGKISAIDARNILKMAASV
jgi:hypothetical protein